MHQVNAAVWNRIGETVPLKTEWAQQIFPLPEDQMTVALDKEAKRLQRTENPIVVAAYLTMLPLLWENQAIAQYKAEHPELMDALPEVADAAEAVTLASRDFPLTESDQTRLRKLLQTPPQ